MVRLVQGVSAATTEDKVRQVCAVAGVLQRRLQFDIRQATQRSFVQGTSSACSGEIELRRLRQMELVCSCGATDSLHGARQIAWACARGRGASLVYPRHGCSGCRWRCSRTVSVRTASGGLQRVFSWSARRRGLLRVRRVDQVARANAGAQERRRFVSSYSVGLSLRCAADKARGGLRCRLVVSWTCERRDSVGARRVELERRCLISSCGAGSSAPTASACVASACAPSAGAACAAALVSDRTASSSVREERVRLQGLRGGCVRHTRRGCAAIIMTTVERLRSERLRCERLRCERLQCEWLQWERLQCERLPR